MSNELVPFYFDGHNVRIHMDDAGEPWWVATDVCDILGLGNTSKAVARLEPDERGITVGDTPSGMQNLLTVNESGLYRLIFRSNRTEAKQFQKWVFSEVLPQIRKTGRYEPMVPQVSDPALRMLLDQTRAMERIIVDLDHARTEAKQAQSMALQAMQAQQYMTIREYVMFNDLVRQLPPGKTQQEFGKYLAGHCRDTGWPLRKMPTENPFTEWAYPVHVITERIHPWLARRNSQLRIDIHEGGVWYNNDN